MTGPAARFAAVRFEPDGRPVGTAVALPGRVPQYSALLLGFAAQALTQHGWAVDQLWWDPPDHGGDDDADYAWVRDRLDEAAPAEGRVLVVGKSLGTLAAPLAAERAYDAIWLTPLLHERRIVDAVAANPGRQLLVGGTGDASWDSGVARELEAGGCRVLEIPDADHSLLVPGDIVRGAGIHVEIVRAIDSFLGGVGATQHR